MKYAKKIVSFGRAAFNHFLATEALTRASDLAYTTLLSLFPLIILSLGLFSALPSLKPYVAMFHQFLFQNLVPDAASSLQYYVESFAQQSTRLSILSMLAILIAAIMLVFSIETAFNKIWKIKTRRKGIRAFLIYLAILVLLPPIALSAFASTAFLFSLPYMSSIIKSVYEFSPILYLVPISLLFLLLLVSYKALPNCEVQLCHAALGAAVGAPLLELVKIGFGAYITHFSSFTLIYGAAAVIPIFLLWLYVLWLIVIIGAIVAYISGRGTMAVIPEESVPS